MFENDWCIMCLLRNAIGEYEWVDERWKRMNVMVDR